MTDGHSGPVFRPDRSRGRWNSFTTAGERGLNETANPNHRVRVEFDGHTVLVHLSDEDGHGWTTMAVDRPSRAWSVAQRGVQLDAAVAAVRGLYRGSDDR